MAAMENGDEYRSVIKRAEELRLENRRMRLEAWAQIEQAMALRQQLAALRSEPVARIVTIET
ncbi:MAG: hypothetical protein EOS79_16505 [Mesorhizobium sp.]|uniref:hypothetical protein n=1 Tax=Mesorhizobium sp. TaxID=1871066 RepID=UPI000FE89923|nr:hypothetical protein [Mesorhizobium sp.]RWE42267.1 MAG: hypothetical protein EOS79_16505 [Mesorhizobium sp.]